MDVCGRGAGRPPACPQRTRLRSREGVSAGRDIRPGHDGDRRPHKRDTGRGRARPERARGDHPLCSFAAVGPGASRVFAGQTASDVYAPLRALAESDGYLVLLGVGLTSATLLHLAEECAGRTLFRRWARGPDGETRMVPVGGCSDGFDAFAPLLAPVKRETRVGASAWIAYPAAEMLSIAIRAIQRTPALTHCPDPACVRCSDAVAGGPLLDQRSS